MHRYIGLLKIEKSSESSPRSSDKELPDHGAKKPLLEMEKTIFTLKRIIEKLQVENRRLKLGMKKNLPHHTGVQLISCIYIFQCNFFTLDSSILFSSTLFQLLIG